MRLLAIDTSTRTLCCGLADGEKHYGFDVEYGPKLSRWLVPALGRVLETLSIKPEAIDCFACGIGPGSFTGIRLGMSCVKGLAWAGGKPVAGVPSLDIIALNARREAGDVCCVSDAKRGLVYCAFYRFRAGAMKRTSPYLLLDPSRLAGEIKRRQGKKPRELALCGDGIPVVKPCFQGKGLSFLDGDYWKPQGRNLLELALRTAEEKRLSDSLSVKPLYLYPQECQIRK
jgi:tRNA threonylcarbamoyladenosine biosynthesis protein TsaB